MEFNPSKDLTLDILSKEESPTISSCFERRIIGIDLICDRLVGKLEGDDLLTFKWKRSISSEIQCHGTVSRFWDDESFSDIASWLTWSTGVIFPEDISYPISSPVIYRTSRPKGEIGHISDKLIKNHSWEVIVEIISKTIGIASIFSIPSDLKVRVF